MTVESTCVWAESGLDANGRRSWRATGADRPSSRRASDQAARGAARRLRRRDARLNEHSAGARLHEDRRDACRHRSLHRPPAPYRFRRLRLVAPPGGGGRFGYRCDLLGRAFSHGAARQRPLHGARRHADAGDRRRASARADLQGRLPGGLPLAHCSGWVSDGGWNPGRRGDARRHARRRRGLPPYRSPAMGGCAGGAVGGRPRRRRFDLRRGEHSFGPQVCAPLSGAARSGCRRNRGERLARSRGAGLRRHRSGAGRAAVAQMAERELERYSGADAGRRLVLRHDHRPERSDRAHLCGQAQGAGRRERRHPGALGRQRRRGAERRVRGQRQSDPDRDGGGGRSAKPGRAARLRRRRRRRASVPDRPAAIPAALRSGEHRVHHRCRHGRR